MRSFTLAALVLVAAVAMSGGAQATEEEDYRSIQIPTREDFLASRFDSLEERSQDFRESDARTGGGYPKLRVFYETFETKPGPYEKDGAPDYDRLEDQARAWLKAYPFSKPASILLAKTLLNHAWKFRGDGWASTVSAAQWRKYSDYVHQAEDQIEKSRRFALDDPEWYFAALNIARAASWPREDFDRLADEALERHYAYSPLYGAILGEKLPKWGGSWPEFSDWVDRIIARTAKDDGQSAYARIYWWLDRPDGGAHLFERTPAKWPVMKQGFDDLVARYPSDWNLNAYGAYACLAGDMDALGAVLDRLQGRFVDKLWSDKVQRNSCEYAVLAKRRQAEDMAHFRERRPKPAEMLERDGVLKSVGEDFMAGRFEKLDAVHQLYLASGETTSSGEPKLELFYNGLLPIKMMYEGRRADQPDYAGVEQMTQKWLDASSGSTAAAVAAARLDALHARLLLSPFYSFQHPDGNAMLEGTSLLRKARDRLETVRDAASSDPQWWATLLSVAAGENESDEDFAKLAREALGRHPHSSVVRSAILERSWGRAYSKGAFDDAADLIVAAGQPQDAKLNYAEAYLWLSQVNRAPDLFSRTRANWPLLKQGLDELIAARPTDWNLNAYANFACMAKDKAAAKTAIDKLGGRIIEERWTDWRAPGNCSAWAAAG